MDDFSFNISSDCDPFTFRLTWLRTSSWLRTHMYWDDGLSKLTEEKTAKMYRFCDAWLFLYRSIAALISSPDQRFSVGIRRVLALICAMKLYIFEFRSLKLKV